MSISFAERIDVTCPNCNTPFTSDSFVIVDGVERPDLAQRILDDTLHDTRCPNCGQTGRVPAPVFYHDARHRRVLFAVPPDMPEDEWRMLGQNLLWVLIGALPEEQRLPYLGDVQAEAGLAGIALVIRNERLAGSGEDDDEDVPPIVIAIEDLLAAHNSAALSRVFDRHPILQQPQAVTIMQELAAEARKQQQSDAAAGFARAAELLEQVKQLREQTQAGTDTSAATHELSPEVVETLAFALLRSTTGATLAEAVDQHPELLEEWTDAPLAEYAAQARRDNKPRIAEGLDERLTVLREMRAQYQQQQPILDAVQAYLQAETPDQIEEIVLEHEVLTTPAADDALMRLAHNARADGDESFAAFVEERRVFLQQVRAVLDDSALGE